MHRNRRCSYGQLQHLFVDGFMAFQNSNINRKEETWNNFDLKMIYGSCDRYEGSYLIGW